MEKRKIIEDFISQRQNSVAMTAAFGYGSGVIQQKGYSLQKKPMIDLIFIVQDSKAWHQENKKKNPHDYPVSAKILLGTVNFDRIAGFSGVTYQSHISYKGETFKYGVVSQAHFIHALYSWNSFFLPGRFQKPVQTIFSNPYIDWNIQENRRIALLVALQTLPEQLRTLKGLFTQICSLSYLGDIRMVFVENPNKIRNIVEAEFELFKKIYVDNEDYHSYFAVLDSGEILVNDELVDRDLKHTAAYLYTIETGEVGTTPSKNWLKDLEKINRVESITQPVVGLLTAGPITSAKYIHEKMLKKEKRVK